MLCCSIDKLLSVLDVGCIRFLLYFESLFLLLVDKFDDIAYPICLTFFFLIKFGMISEEVR
jgi:hypothetical protein